MLLFILLSTKTDAFLFLGTGKVSVLLPSPVQDILVLILDSEVLVMNSVIFCHQHGHGAGVIWTLSTFLMLKMPVQTRD
jgi:hypothetical protein